MSFPETPHSFTSKTKKVAFSSPIAGPSKSNKTSDDGDKMKVKFIEVWNNFKFDFHDVTEMNFKIDSPLWLLGKCYLSLQANKTESNEKKRNGRYQESQEFYDLQSFMDDFSSKPWFSYRKGFPPFDDTNLTSDTGWGCMIRTTQMLLCQGFFMHFLGRNWRWTRMKPSDLIEKRLHREILGWFIDEPNQRCPFSIHRLTDFGLNYKCKPGDWYGPSTVAYIMQDAVECAKGLNSKLNELVVYVAQDCTVYTDDIREMCRWKKSSPSSNSVKQRSVIILIPLRLGESVINPIYIPCIQKLFTFQHCLGVVGGKPKHSLYFVGVQDEHLLYLDPHYSQPSDTLQTFSNKQLETYHNSSPRRVHISKIDPSCCLGFYCRNEDEFNMFAKDALKYTHTTTPKTSCSLFLIVDGSVRDFKYDVGVTELSENNDTSFECLTAHSDDTTESSSLPEGGNATSNHTNFEVLSTSKSDKFFSFSKPKELLSNFSRQLSRSPKAVRKQISLEEEFEML